VPALTLVVGHAAAAGEAPANTLAGVRACVDAGAEAMEIDVQLSANGVPVLMHDDTVDRTTNLSGPVRTLTAAQLTAADAGEGEPVPMLQQVLELVAGRLSVFCELKATPGDPAQDERLVEAVSAVVAGSAAETWCAIHSFNPSIVERARALAPRVSTAIISPRVTAEGLERLLGGAIRRGAQAVSIEHGCIDRGLVVAAKRRQLTVWAWTADEELDWQRLVEAGVDGIVTNFPHRLRDYIDGASTKRN
jgi:glycerophosphoryl diester phosphodiesterase